jgi:hypothetical protein
VGDPGSVWVGFAVLGANKDTNDDPNRAVSRFEQ